MRKINIFWSKNPQPGNFGDILTPFILNHYGIECVHTSSANPDYLCIGSIAKFARKNTIVLGSGAMSRENELCSSAKWIWVRGPQTRSMIIQQGGSCPEIYGDPALLLPKIYNPVIEPKYDVGIVPHYVDYEYCKKRYPNEKVINLLNKNPLSVVDEILQCRSIISSSLHGIIAAHAYGRPAAWVKFSDKLNGDGIKFEDHFESINRECILSTIDNPVFIDSADMKTGLIDQILNEKKFLEFI